MPVANVEYKDRVFKFIFGNPNNRPWTLALYNAINASNYDDPNAIKFNTIDDAVYVGMINDASFIIMSELNIWEHQSTYNPNMPLRVLFYAAKLYEKYIEENHIYLYSSTLKKIPTPKFVCFYNGTRNQPEKKILRLSDAYDGEGDLEVTVTMLNINYGKNKELMNACKPLQEYAWLVNEVRQNPMGDLDVTIDNAIDNMPKDFVIRDFIIGHRAEVKGMFLTEWNQEEALAHERDEGREEGRAEGRAEGIAIGEQRGEQRSQRSIYERLISSGKFTAQEAAEFTGWNGNAAYGLQ